MLDFYGSCIYKIKGLNTERLINTCLKNKIDINFIDRKGQYLFVVCKYSQNQEFKKVIKNYEVVDVRYTGLCGIFNLLKKRFSILIGIFFTLAILLFWQTHLFSYSVKGLEGIKKSEIIAVLQNSGYGIGCKLSQINLKEVENQLLAKFDNIAFVSTIKYGTSLIINIKEKEYDEDLDESLILPIVAQFDGVIDEIEVYQGTVLVSNGDIVKKNQILIAPYIVKNGEQVSVRARGNVYATVFVKGQVVFNENSVSLVRSGKYKKIRELNFFGTTFKTNSDKVDYKHYEVEKSSKIICKNMPICFKIIETRYYELIEEPIKRNFEDEKEFLIKKSKYDAYENLKANFDVVEEKTDIVLSGENYYITTYLKIKTNIGVVNNESDI